MATRPKAAFSGRNPFPDLPFLAQPAFIWDRTGGAVTWMNGAAQAKYGLSALELQAALPASLLRKLKRRAGGGGSKGNGPVELRLAASPPVICSVELIELANGHRGFILAEAAAGEIDSAPAQLQKAELPAKARRQAKRSPGKGEPGACIPQLTPDELKAFKAIGRKVRRLVKEKQRGPVPAKSPARASFEALPAPGLQAAAAILYSAFDLVLFLGKDFTILNCEGRPQRIGWRKQAMLGKPAARLLPLGEQAAFARMRKKVAVDGAQTCRETFVVCGEAGSGTPCRLILGHWPGGKAPYFLALLSLSPPSRLRRPRPPDLPLPQARLAA